MRINRNARKIGGRTTTPARKLALIRAGRAERAAVNDPLLQVNFHLKNALNRAEEGKHYRYSGSPEGTAKIMLRQSVRSLIARKKPKLP